MIYRDVQKAIFLDRPNRFVAHVQLNGKNVSCHVKNTGRCRELLIPGAEIYVQHREQPERKTAYDVIAVQKKGRLVNLDSAASNRVFHMDSVQAFEANRVAQPAFADALRAVKQDGVQVLAYDCHVTPDSLDIANPVPIRY